MFRKVIVRPFKFFQLTIIFTFAALLHAGLAHALCSAALPTGVECVNATANKNVMAFGTCKTITNSHASNKAIFIPIKTSGEWSQFYGHAPSGVTLANCASTGALVSWWKFDEASYSGAAGEVVDSVGAHNGQSMASAAPDTVAKFGRSLNVLGTSSQYVKVPYTSAFDFGTSNFSVSTWIQMPNNLTINSSVSIAGNHGSGTSTGFGFRVDTNGYVVFRLNVGAAQHDAEANVMIRDGVWHHLAATVDRASNIIIYVDGVQAAPLSAGLNPLDISAASAATVNSGGNIFVLGARRDLSNFMTGNLDDFAIYNRVLTPTEISNIYAGQPY